MTLAMFHKMSFCKKVLPADSNWLRGLDLNQRPSGYEPDELPGCSTPRLGIRNMTSACCYCKKFRFLFE